MSVAEDRGPLPADRAAAADHVQQVLDRVREHLGMDIAFLSALSATQEVVLATSRQTGPLQMSAGDVTALDETYCVRVLAGLLPSVVPDARRHPVTRDLPVTEEQGIGSYVGAPLRGPDGEPVGMLCCLGRGPNPLLDEHAARVVALAAALVEDRMGVLGLPHRPGVSGRERWVREVLAAGTVGMAFQPVAHLASGEVVAVEALSRFDPARFVSPAHAFAAATAAGVGVELELLAVRCALTVLPRVPAGVHLAVNLSAEALLDPRTPGLLLPHGGALGVEITEHAPVRDYAALVRVTDRLKAGGLEVAVDDAGAGFASLHHVLQLRPTAIKLDMTLVRGIDADPVRQALARAVADVAGTLGARLVAEGVETVEERDTLLRLGVAHGQGYLLGRPGPWEDALG